MEIFQHFINIISNEINPTIVEFGTCDGVHTNVMCSILKQMGKKFNYHAFEGDSRIIPRFWYINQNHLNDITLNYSVIGDVDGLVKFHFSGGEETREGAFKQSFYGSSSIKSPKLVTEFWPDMTFDEGEVKSYRFDTYYEEKDLDIIDFIWTDIQGAEIEMISGGQKALSKTRYLYTEYSDHELYEGEVGLQEIIKKLPGEWEIIEDYKSDVLLKNKMYK